MVYLGSGKGVTKGGKTGHPWYHIAEQWKILEQFSLFVKGGHGPIASPLYASLEIKRISWILYGNGFISG